MSSAWLTELAHIYPSDRLLTQAAQLAPYESDALTAYRIRLYHTMGLLDSTYQEKP